MSTIQSVKNQIQTLIDNANATTGKGDTNLTTAQNSLIEGYGQGGSGSGGIGISFSTISVKGSNSVKGSGSGEFNISTNGIQFTCTVSTT